MASTGQVEPNKKSQPVRPSRRTEAATDRRLLFIFAIGAALLVGLWVLHGIRVSSRVEVVTDAEVLSCDGTQVRVEETERADKSVNIPVFDAVPDMHCEMAFSIRNASGIDVTVKTISIPVLGPRGRAGAQATRLDPYHDDATSQGSSAPIRDEIDAIWHIGHQLASGETLNYTVTIEFARGCSPASNVLLLERPLIEVASFGRTLDLDPADLMFGIHGSQYTECSS